MNTNYVLVISKQLNRILKNSINLDINLDSNVHGLDIVKYIDNLIESVLIKNKNIEWVVYDIELNSDNIEDMIIINSYLPHYIYNKYYNLKFIFNSSGQVFGEHEWSKTEIDSHNPISLYAKSRSTGEVKGDRSWLLRYDLFDEKFLDQNLLVDKVYYASIDVKYSYITNKSLNNIIDGLIDNYKEIEPETYHIVPIDTHTEYELLNYLCWKKNLKSYIERSSSIYPSNQILKTCKPKILKTFWKHAGYTEIPTFKILFDELA